MKVARGLATALVVLGFLLPFSQSIADPGRVELPLDIYQKLLGGAQPTSDASFSEVHMVVSEVPEGSLPTFEVRTVAQVTVFGEGRQQVTLFSRPVAMQRALANGQAASLRSQQGGIAWTAPGPGTYNLELVYRVEGNDMAGNGIALPVLPAVSTRFSGRFTRDSGSVEISPATGIVRTQDGAHTQVQADLPGGTDLRLRIRGKAGGNYLLSRANYQGSVREQAIEWQVNYTVDVLSNVPARVAILPSSVALKDVQVDRKMSPILRLGDDFATLVEGKGKHTIRANFLVPIVRNNGPASASFDIEGVPISEFRLDLPGNKQVTTAPSADIHHQRQGSGTQARVFLPLADHVSFSWSEAVPSASEEELRANSTVHHWALAEEGVLHSYALVDYQVTRGETHRIELDVPAGIDVNNVHSEEAGIKDWRMSNNKGKPNILTVFFDRPVNAAFRLMVDYELLLNSEDKTFEMPLLSVRDTHRQRGMVALLAGRERAMSPKKEEGATRVGENQLPDFVRSRLGYPVQHTYRYVGESPKLRLATVAPQRKVARFDARVDTLISLGDATLKGSARVVFDIKAGAMDSAQILIPPGINVLDISAPSLRNHRVEKGAKGGKLLILEFTQSMEGQFSAELSYERILRDSDSALAVPTVHVGNAEVEQGQIAVEALAAMEVIAEKAEELSAIETELLPPELLMQASNTVLMAFRYTQSEAVPQLSLRLTRHDAIATQAAIIDEAHYATLMTDEGIMVTSARFTVRNQREQFLKLRLPKGSEVWKAFVAGNEEKPALVKGADKNGPEVMVGIINSTDPFIVDLVYKTPRAPLSSFGKLEASLPITELISTRTIWDLYLPEGHDYRKIQSNMRLRYRETVDELSADIPGYGDAELRIGIPRSGVHFHFEKVFAGQGRQVSAVSIFQVSRSIRLWETMLACMGMAGLLIGAFLLWTGRQRVIWIGRVRRIRLASQVSVVMGIAFLTFTLGYLQTSSEGPFAVVVALSLSWGLYMGWRQRHHLLKIPRAILRRRPALHPPMAAAVNAPGGVAVGVAGGASGPVSVEDQGEKNSGNPEQGPEDAG